MSKIPYTRNSPQNRPQQTPVPADPNQPLEGDLVTAHPMLEDPDALAARLADTEDFLRRKKGILLGLLTVLVVAVVGAFAYFTWRSSQDTKAQAAMFQAVNYWEADSLKKAMKGDGQYDGLEAIASEYGGTKAGNLANFYAGVGALKQGQYQAAIDYLEDFSSKDLLVQARAYALLGDANMELNKYKEAADLYSKAASHNANEFFSPGYLMKEAAAREMAKDYDGAVKAYDKILNDYQNAQEVAEAKQFKARAEGLTGK
ncbi:cytochrome C biosynthesis protein [Hymenobacter sp. BT635]|uniref:Cytochrome C biosynthesis protein n=1 Tax=Hymenobacter nitidus TaxID=2880929 RepID=A0ABS8AIF7_9BACT|nr:cytochrome C biosynthesis protein [Hymenobacter nitidus]MCB2380147.1 cytochrome C biosynthesis protein [Hymenobacter nitidus]